MGRCVFTNKNYCIYTFEKGYIIHNKNKPFDEGHTHWDNFRICKVIIYCCMEGKFPDKAKRLAKNYRVVESICRLAPIKHRKYFEEILEGLKNNQSLVCDDVSLENAM